MRIELITSVYNEEFLIPFFFRHYDFVDRLNILFGEDSTDRSAELLKANPKVRIIPGNHPDGIDDVIKVNDINRIYAEIEADFVLNPDFDEFIFIDREGIEKLPENESIFMVRFRNCWRHESDEDLDPLLPIKEQRRHGEPGGGKPIIVRGGIEGLQWNEGNHGVNIGTFPWADLNLFGAHWAMADPCFCVGRRVRDRAERISRVNVQRQFGVHYLRVTEKSVMADCVRHRRDQELW